MKDNIAVLAALGAFLTASGAFANWWAARFPSNYRASYLLLAQGFAIAAVLLAGFGAWAWFSNRSK